MSSSVSLPALMDMDGVGEAGTIEADVDLATLIEFSCGLFESMSVDTFTVEAAASVAYKKSIKEYMADRGGRFEGVFQASKLMCEACLSV